MPVVQEGDVLGIFLAFHPYEIESEVQTVWVRSQSTPTSPLQGAGKEQTWGNEAGADLPWNIDIQGQSLLIFCPLIFSRKQRSRCIMMLLSVSLLFSRAACFAVLFGHFSLLQISFSSSLVRSATLLPRSL